MADAESSAFSASKSTMVIDSSTVDVTGGLSAAALTGNRTCTGLKCSLGAAPSSRSAPKVWLRVSLTRETSASFDNLLRMLAIVSSPSSKSRPSSKFSSSDSLVVGSAYDEVNLAALHSRSRVSIQTPLINSLDSALSAGFLILSTLDNRLSLLLGAYRRSGSELYTIGD